MDSKFQSLPPLKRFTLLQQLEENKENSGANSLILPAKKRKDSRDHPLLPLQPTSIKDSYPIPTATTTYCLPAKKRVWAPPPVLAPDLVQSKPLSPFDLNVEYKPSFNEEININEEKKNTYFGLGHCKEGEEVGKRGQTCFNETQLVKEEEEKGDEDGILCAVCQSTDGDPMDPIVFCDGCDLMVHVTCYGNPLIKGVPEGEWYCNQCEFYRKGNGGSEKALSCCLCPCEGGALKATAGNEGSWAHLVCALLVPEVFFEDPDGREGIDCSKVPKRRREGKCYICKRRKGCVIECSEEKCPLAFHVTCGLSEDLCIEYKEGRKKETIVAGFCKSHTELWNKEQQTGKFKIVARE